MPVACKRVFKKKLNTDGTVGRYKARLVAKGYSQIPGLDYNETFAPVVKSTSVRILLAIAAHHNLLVHQLDVKTTFLNGLLEEDIYISQPKGFMVDQDKVCKLLKTLYGLKQASRA